MKRYFDAELAEMWPACLEIEDYSDMYVECNDTLEQLCPSFPVFTLKLLTVY